MNDPRLVQFEELIQKFTDEDLQEEYKFQVERLEMMNAHTIYNKEEKLHCAELIRLVTEEQQRRLIP